MLELPIFAKSFYLLCSMLSDLEDSQFDHPFLDTWLLGFLLSVSKVIIEVGNQVP